VLLELAELGSEEAMRLFKEFVFKEFVFKEFVFKEFVFKELCLPRDDEDDKSEAPVVPLIRDILGMLPLSHEVPPRLWDTSHEP